MPLQVKRLGMLIVISAPSGGGKSEVLKRLLAAESSIRYSVSYTSRPPRGDEADGVHYHFVAREKFEEMIGAGAFYEAAEVHGNYYGTSAKLIEAALRDGKEVAMDLDIQGGLNIKKRRPDAVLIFLIPPSMDVLERRLRGRATDAEAQIRLRLENAKREIVFWDQYDYVVVNEDIERTMADVLGIVRAERLRSVRSAVSLPPAH